MKSILIIDDNTDIRENTCEILQLSGYKCFTTENGKKGVELALKEKPDLIVCDIMMPELDGYGVLHLLRKNIETQYIPFIFLTAKTERSDLRKGMEMGADDYITKPFDDVELLNAIEVRLNRKMVFDNQYQMNRSGINQFLKDVNSNGILNRLEENYNIEVFNKKQIIYSYNKKPRFLYFVVSGKVKCYKLHDDGKEYITDLLTAGDFIGYQALINDQNYTDSAMILEDSEILQIPKEDFLQMIYTDIQVAIKFIGIITQNIKEKEERLVNLAYNSLRKRVANALVELHIKYNPDSTKNALEISRKEIAQYIGTATESLIRTLSDFKAENLIVINEGSIIISNFEKLKNLVG